MRSNGAQEREIIVVLPTETLLTHRNKFNGYCLYSVGETPGETVNYYPTSRSVVNEDYRPSIVSRYVHGCISSGRGSRVDPGGRRINQKKIQDLLGEDGEQGSSAREQHRAHVP